MNYIINSSNTYNVKIMKSEFENLEDYEEYKKMPNASINRAGTADEYVSFNTFSKQKKYSKPRVKKIKTIFKLRQLNSQGGVCCDFGFFETREMAIKAMFKGIEKLYKGFKKNYHFDGHNQWHYSEKDFIMDIQEIEFNTFGEI